MSESCLVLIVVYLNKPLSFFVLLCMLSLFVPKQVYSGVQSTDV